MFYNLIKRRPNNVTILTLQKRAFYAQIWLDGSFDIRLLTTTISGNLWARYDLL